MLCRYVVICLSLILEKITFFCKIRQKIGKKYINNVEKVIVRKIYFCEFINILKKNNM